jgi:hypothetical protein
LLYRAKSDVLNDQKQPLVSAYAVRRLDSQLAVLLLNKNPERQISVRLEQTLDGATEVVRGRPEVDQFSSEQYVWVADRGQNDHPEFNLRPERIMVLEEEGAVLTLPPYSITVARAG